MKKDVDLSVGLTDDNLFDFLKMAKQYSISTAEENRKLYSQYMMGDMDAYQKLVLGNIGLVLRIVRKYEKNLQSYELLDLIQEGIIGIVEALGSYDPEKATFSTYATPKIIKNVMKALSNYDKTIRRPRYIFYAVSRYHKIVNRHMLNGESTYSDKEMIQELRVSPRLYEEVKADNLYNPQSLNASIPGFDDLEIVDSLPNKISEIGSLLDKMADNDLFFYLKKTLTNYQYYILYYRVFSDKKMTMENIALKFGVSGSTVKAHLESIFRKLRNVYAQQGIAKFFSEKIDIENFEHDPIDPDSIMRYLFIEKSLNETARTIYREWIYRSYTYGIRYYLDKFGITYEELKSTMEDIKREISKIDTKEFCKFREQIISTYGIKLLDTKIEDIVLSDKNMGPKL